MGLLFCKENITNNGLQISTLWTLLRPMEGVFFCKVNVYKKNMVYKYFFQQFCIITKILKIMCQNGQA
jgi:hypothetical protein